MNIESFLIIVMAIGYFAGGISCWYGIKRYKQEQGLNPDPLDGKQLTKMERYVQKNRHLLKED